MSIIASSATTHTHTLSLPPPQKEEFFIYQEYGEGNEAAQKLLYELQDNESFQAFFLVSVQPYHPDVYHVLHNVYQCVCVCVVWWVVCTTSV